MNRIGRVGKEGSAQKLIVKPRTEDATLRFSEIGAKALVVLDIRDQLLDLGRRLLPRRDRLELRVDRIALGQKCRPEVGLRLVVLVLQDRPSVRIDATGTIEVGGQFGKSARAAGVTVSTCSGVQICVILYDVDNIERVVISGARREFGLVAYIGSNRLI